MDHDDWGSVIESIVTGSASSGSDDADTDNPPPAEVSEDTGKDQ